MVLDGKLESDIVVESALVNMYIKCSSLDEAQMVFVGVQSRNVVAWTIMVTAYAQHNMDLKAYRSHSIWSFPLPSCLRKILQYNIT